VRATAEDRWLALCPAHDDRSPSLSIRETGDGTVLVKCWAGCEAPDVLAAVGLELRDLFPPRPSAHGPIRHQRDRMPAREALTLLDREAVLVHVAALEIAAGRVLTDADRARLGEAVGRIGRVVAATEGRA
jgi:hypothetical protein